MIMEAKKFQDLLLASRRSRKAVDVKFQSKSWQAQDPRKANFSV